jgi:hypothetical protein
MSHAVLLDTLDTGGIQSVARGFARNVAANIHDLHCRRRRPNCHSDIGCRGGYRQEGVNRFRAPTTKA